jgi:flagellar basal body-associated protein FliL
MAAGKKKSGRIVIIIILIALVGIVLAYLLLTGAGGAIRTPTLTSQLLPQLQM